MLNAQDGHIVAQCLSGGFLKFAAHRLLGNIEPLRAGTERKLHVGDILAHVFFALTDQIVRLMGIVLDNVLLNIFGEARDLLGEL